MTGNPLAHFTGAADNGYFHPHPLFFLCFLLINYLSF
jgi:hypothetical protein